MSAHATTSSPGANERGLALSTIRPFDIAAWVNELQEKHAAPGVKQHQLAAVRMLFDWLVTSKLRDGTNKLCRADAPSGFRIGFRMEQFLPVHRVGSDCRLPFGRGEPVREAMRGSLLRLRMGLWVKQDDIIEIQ